MEIFTWLKDLFTPNHGNHYVPHFLRTNIFLYVVLVVLLIKIMTVAIYLPVFPNVFFADITKIDLVHLLNENRQSVGLNPLQENKALDQVAYLKAQDMVKNGYFAHQSPAGITPWFWFKQVGYTYTYAGENLAVGFFDSKTVYDAWSNSPSHKANLLNPHYTQVGTAVVEGFDGNAILVVQEFGNPVVKTATASVKKPAPPVVNPEPIVVQNPPAPEQSPIVTQEPTQETPPQVLSATNEYITANNGNSKQSIYLSFLHAMVYENNTLLNGIAFNIILFIIACIIFDIILTLTLPNKKTTARSLVLIVILTMVMVINKDTIHVFTPHQIVIQGMLN